MKYGTLLVIDDNPSILTALKICSGNTFERILPCLARYSPTLLRQEQVDLILLDMNFSLGINERVRTACSGSAPSAGSRPHPLTAFATCSLPYKGLKSGAAHSSPNPRDHDELIRVLKDAIDNNTEVATLENFENDYIRKVVDNATATSRVQPKCSE